MNCFPFGNIYKLFYVNNCMRLIENYLIFFILYFLYMLGNKNTQFIYNCQSSEVSQTCQGKWGLFNF